MPMLEVADCSASVKYGSMHEGAVHEPDVLPPVAASRGGCTSYLDVSHGTWAPMLLCNCLAGSLLQPPAGAPPAAGWRTTGSTALSRTQALTPVVGGVPAVGALEEAGVLGRGGAAEQAAVGAPPGGAAAADAAGQRCGAQRPVRRRGQQRPIGRICRVIAERVQLWDSCRTAIRVD